MDANNVIASFLFEKKKKQLSLLSQNPQRQKNASFFYSSAFSPVLSFYLNHRLRDQHRDNSKKST